MARTLIHETWGDHAALIARSEAEASGSVGPVQPRLVDVATYHDPLTLQYGGILAHVAVAFETYGSLNRARDNAILLCHALTGSAHAAGLGDAREVPGWWDPLVGPGKAVDTREHFVVCSNILGGCYGSTGPSSLNPKTGRAYRLDFPRYTVRDMVTVQRRLLDRLGVQSLKAVVGGSMGGMQVLEWAAMYPGFVRGMVPIAVGARHSAWAIGLNEVARRAITSDPLWRGGDYPQGRQPETGLGLARAVAMLSYRSFDSLESKFGRERVSASRGLLEPSFEIESYLSYQGVKLVKRFDANTYLYITKAMDDYDLSEDRGRLAEVLRGMRLPALVMGIDSDVLYPESEQKALVEALPRADYASIRSPHGHDAFLIEFPQLAVRLRRFLGSVV
ncbi:MAG: homoserine O-acetyltransferase [Deinococcota bacterium]|jgi:homoserine O-acetyltransferase|nr:homoserine O-acetyltransferase [Deinococcota bacterium]